MPFDLPPNHLDLLCYDAHRPAEVRAAYISQPPDDVDHEHYHRPEQRRDTGLTPPTGDIRAEASEPIVITEMARVTVV
jgi:hypothetical protein